MQLHFKVEGMTCQRCVGRVRAAVLALTGVHGVNVELTTGDVTVEALGDANRAAIASAITAAGYPAEPVASAQ